MGNFDAMRELAMMYAEGEGVERNWSEAVRWFVKCLEDEMVMVEGGSFTMGGSSSVNRVEVLLDDFMIAETEVTQALYESVMGKNPSHFKGARRPAECISWYDAVEFCNKLSEASGLEKCYSGSGNNIICDFSKNGYRLPTKAEWEYAARAGVKSKGFKYSGSNDIGEVAWYWDNSDKQTHPVKSKKPNEIGLYDMSGNVWEWCWDLYSSSGWYRVYRGGGWGSYAGYADRCSVSSLDCYYPSRSYDDLGFRLARSAKD